MAGHAGPNVSKELRFALSPDSYSQTKANTNLLAEYPWTLGTGGETFYGANGDGNARIISDNPFGQQDIIWQTYPNDATSNADGGWNTSQFSVDPTKTYRFSVWVRRVTLGNGNFYLGCHGYGSTTGITSNDSATWSANTNPYFCSTGWPLAVGQWYLVVGHVFPHDWTTLGDHPDSGWYLPNNTTKVRTIDDRDYRWHSTTTTANHRSYLYYSTDTETNQQWWAPRVDLCDGSEPSINDLVTSISSRTDLVSNEDIGLQGVVKTINTSDREPSYYAFDGLGAAGGVPTGSYISVTESTTDIRNYPNGCTYNFWINVDTDAVDRMSLFFGAGTIRHIEIYSSTKKFRTEAAKQNGYSFGSGVFPDNVRGEWSHFAIVFATNESGRPVRWYQNGKLFYTGSLDNGTYPGTEYFSFNKIGYPTGSGYAPSFKGKISSFAVLEKALSKNEVRRTYAALRRRYK